MGGTFVYRWRWRVEGPRRCKLTSLYPASSRVPSQEPGPLAREKGLLKTPLHYALNPLGGEAFDFCCSVIADYGAVYDDKYNRTL